MSVHDIEVPPSGKTTQLRVRDPVGVPLPVGRRAVVVRALRTRQARSSDLARVHVPVRAPCQSCRTCSHRGSSNTTRMLADEIARYPSSCTKALASPDRISWTSVVDVKAARLVLGAPMQPVDATEQRRLRPAGEDGRSGPRSRRRVGAGATARCDPPRPRASHRPRSTTADGHGERRSTRAPEDRVPIEAELEERPPDRVPRSSGPTRVLVERAAVPGTTHETNLTPAADRRV